MRVWVPMKYNLYKDRYAFAKGLEELFRGVLMYRTVYCYVRTQGVHCFDDVKDLPVLDHPVIVLKQTATDDLSCLP